LWQLDPDSPAYNISAALAMSGPLDGDAVQSALDALVHCHEMLRTRFDDSGDAPRQLIAPVEDLAAVRNAWHWETVDARNLTDDAFNAQLRRLAREPFDLTRGPLFRATLFIRDDERHVLHFVMHHIVGDGWSINVLLRDFAACYRAAQQGAEQALNALPALAIQYADYAAWQRERFAIHGGAQLDAQLDYWRGRLAGYDTLLDLPTLHERGRPYEPRAARVGAHIPAALASRLESLARAENATLFMVLLAAFAALLSRYSGAQDVAIAVPVAGRDRLETEPLIGFFVNTLAIRASVKGAKPFATLLREVRDDSIDAQTNADVPFERVVAALHSGRRAGGSPLAQIKFVLHDEFDTALDLDGVHCALIDADASDARFELALDVLREGDHGLRCVFAYAAELYDDAFVAQFARHYVELLEQVVDTPRCAIGELRLDDEEAANSASPVAGAYAF